MSTALICTHLHSFALICTLHISIGDTVHGIHRPHVQEDRMRWYIRCMMNGVHVIYAFCVLERASTLPVGILSMLY